MKNFSSSIFQINTKILIKKNLIFIFKKMKTVFQIRFITYEANKQKILYA